MTEKCAKCGSIGYFFGTTAGYLYLILLIMYSSITFVNKHLAAECGGTQFFPSLVWVDALVGVFQQKRETLCISCQSNCNFRYFFNLQFSIKELISVIMNSLNEMNLILIHCVETMSEIKTLTLKIVVTNKRFNNGSFNQIQ